ncbi:MAG: hypothetical protein ACI9RG_000306 [Sulfurimonas sp.]
MKLEEVYNVLKESSLTDFYIPKNINKIIFIYKEDIGLSISKVEEDEKDFSYDYFFNSDGSEKKDLMEYDNLIRDLCKLKNFPETYNNIRIEKWGVKYNGQVIYTLSCFNISHPSSLDITLPTSLSTYDFELNFFEMCNEYHGANRIYQARDIVKSKVSEKESCYQDFLDN